MTNEDTGAVTTTEEQDAPSAKCPVLSHAQSAQGTMSNQHWWPNQLNLAPLNKNSPIIDPMSNDFDYAAALDAPPQAVLGVYVGAIDYVLGRGGENVPRAPPNSNRLRSACNETKPVGPANFLGAKYVGVR